LGINFIRLTLTGALDSNDNSLEGKKKRNGNTYRGSLLANQSEYDLNHFENNRLKSNKGFPVDNLIQSFIEYLYLSIKSVLEANTEAPSIDGIP